MCNVVDVLLPHAHDILQGCLSHLFPQILRLVRWHLPRLMPANTGNYPISLEVYNPFSSKQFYHTLLFLSCCTKWLYYITRFILSDNPHSFTITT